MIAAHALVARATSTLGALLLAGAVAAQPLPATGGSAGRVFAAGLNMLGLVFSGISTDGKFVEMVELSRDEHPWFLGCQFHPEFKSKPLAPHPLFASFVHAAFQSRLQTETALEQRPETESAAMDRAAVASEN